MNQKHFINVIICIMTFIFTPLGVRANSLIEDVSDDNVLTSEMNYNFKFFEVNVSESNDYFVEFWLMPARYSDGTYTSFYVYVNDEYQGVITPTKDNWQAIRMDMGETISLSKGRNIIKIGVPSPEIPSVETIKIALTDSEAIISSNAYEDFCGRIEDGMSYSMPEAEEIMSYSNKAPAFSVKHFFDVPLKYTFYKLFKFEEGEKVFLNTYSDSEHCMDVIFCGPERIILVNGSDSDKSEIKDVPMTYGTIQIGTIGGPFYSLASSEELQGLNWKGISVKYKDVSVHTINKYIEIPKTGVYLVRLRHKEPGKTGIANLCLNGKYFYNNLPISFSYVECAIPADGNEYGSMTCSKNPDTDDPFLFIHGASADRIVGIGENAPYWMQMVHSISESDDYVIQEYKVKTSGLSVSNSSSINPESTCDIIAGLDQSLFEIDPELKEVSKRDITDSQATRIASALDVTISGSLDCNGVIEILSKESIIRVAISDISGRILKSFDGNGSSMSISRSSIDFENPGLYILCVDTENGSVSQKVLVN